MKTEREFVDYLQDIFDATVSIDEFTHGMDYSAFEQDEKTVFAVIRAFEIIGEAAKQISESLKNKYPKVAWREMTGIRNKLIHEYFGVNYDVLWKTIKEDIPTLRPEIEIILKDVKQPHS